MFAILLATLAAGAATTVRVEELTTQLETERPGFLDYDGSRLWVDGQKVRGSYRLKHRYLVRVLSENPDSALWVQQAKHAGTRAGILAVATIATAGGGYFLGETLLGAGLSLASTGALVGAVGEGVAASNRMDHAIRAYNLSMAIEDLPR